ncbi:hypothetical protein [Phaeodactylibacter luteus]|uniref:Uncharacterized protein n=1 Tax=Phaeodactylibacter luteus TaxID=1564516 RepID=A0A5C6RH34_9BACT|nr:hypothetical protein [Phaeodactylibacter luteus]TXB61453.1 hypothetical protein FRY97_19130 [Phaeodactylibacter luteus]
MKRLFTFPYARVVYGVIILLVGLILMCIPVIPFGYVGVFIGAYLLHHRIPLLGQAMEWLRQRDDSGRLKRFEKQVDELFAAG